MKTIQAKKLRTICKKRTNLLTGIKIKRKIKMLLILSMIYLLKIKSKERIFYLILFKKFIIKE